MFAVTVDSVTAAVGELADRLEGCAEDPEGAAELAAVPSWSESFSDTFDAGFGLAQAAEANGREGFVAYRDATPLLATPSGFMFDKHVAHASLEGEHGR